MVKTRDLFKKIRDTKGIFHAQMGTIKDKNGMDLTEVEDTKKRWQEYTEELYKKDLHDPDNHNIAQRSQKNIENKTRNTRPLLSCLSLVPYFNSFSGVHAVSLLFGFAT